MGATPTKEGDLGAGHPKRFYEGCWKVEEGCYTTSELYFTQAIENHPGHSFWTKLMEVALANSKRGSQPTSHAPVTATITQEPGLRSPNDFLKTAQNSNTGVFRRLDEETEEGEVSGPVMEMPRWPAPSTTATVHMNGTQSHHYQHFSHNGNNATSTTLNRTLNGASHSAAVEEVPTFTIPVDRRLVDVENYARMLTDIARIYRRKANTSTGASRDMAWRLSLLYNAYAAVRLQVLNNLLKVHFAKHTFMRDKRGADMMSTSKRRVPQTTFVDVEMQESTSRRGSAVHVDVNAAETSLSRTFQSEFTMHSQDQAVSTFWTTVQYFWSANVLSYVMTALRMLRASAEDNDVNVDAATPGAAISPDPSPTTVKAVFDMSLRCFDAVEQQVLIAADTNAHTYLGPLQQNFIAMLRTSTKEIAPKEVSQATSGYSSPPASHNPNGRPAKDGEPSWLRLRTDTSFTAEQTHFMRVAKHFHSQAIPLLDPAMSFSVKLDIQFTTFASRSLKLMTPLDRDCAWYLTSEFGKVFERRYTKYATNAFLRQKCNVPANATLRDWNLFSCVGMEEMCLELLPVAVGKAVILQAMGKSVPAQEIGQKALQFALDIYGSTTPISTLVTTMFQNVSRGGPM